MTPMLAKLTLPVAWLVFFAASVSGHITLTLATKTGLPRSLSALAGFVMSPWVLGTVLCWGTSTVLWLVLLEQHGLARASSVSSLRYALIMIASWLILREAVTPRDVVGAGLIAVGVFVIAR